MQLGTLKIDLERKKVLPFGAADLQPGGLPARGSQAQKRVVIHLSVPEVSRRVSVNCHEFAQKRASQIDKMNSLVDQLATPAPGGVHSPFALVPQSSSVTITATDKHRLTEIFLLYQLVGLTESGMKPMIVPN